MRCSSYLLKYYFNNIMLFKFIYDKWIQFIKGIQKLDTR